MIDGDSWDDGFDEDGGFEGDEVFDAFADYSPKEQSEEDGGGADADGISTLLCTAGNPAGTVSVTVLLSGPAVRVELSPEASEMTEYELAEQIRIVGTLASQQARAAQHAVIATLMDQLGRDPADTRSFLERELELPSPESVNATRAQLFSAHYARDVES